MGDSQPVVPETVREALRHAELARRQALEAQQRVAHAQRQCEQRVRRTQSTVEAARRQRLRTGG